MELKNNNITVNIDRLSGATTSIKHTPDTTEMNWIMENLRWGLIPDYNTIKVEKYEDTVTVYTQSADSLIEVKIEKNITEKDYFERYTVENKGDAEFFLTKDNFGIPFPYQCHYGDGGDLFNKSINHLWCGGNICWIYSARTNGEKPYLLMNLTEGAIEDYSIDYDISLVQKGVDYRGRFILHPKDCIIPPKGNISLSFRYRFSDYTPDTAPLDFDGALRFTAQKYSVKSGEKVKLTLESQKEIENIVIRCGDEIIPCSNNGKTAECYVCFDTVGERTITAEINGKYTFLRLNVLEDFPCILEKRAHFIANKQQYHNEASHLDGAYLIYDSETDGLYYGKTDHNAGRERIAMGIVVCKQLQAKYCEELMASLKKHRKFVERELFDTETAEVFNDVCRNNKHPRIYNLPWFSVYYHEWYKLTGEKQCLINSARIQNKYYELNGKIQDSQCIEAVEIAASLKKEGLNELRAELIKNFISHVDSIIERNGRLISKEVTYASEAPNTDCAYFSQAYILTGNKQYLKEAEKYMKMSKAFYGCQPDFHLNCVNVRYWDNYWFGKIRSYGDVFPHYWSTLTAWALGWYDRAANTDNKQDIYNNLTGNLCIYKPDGFAANCYLYPYRIELYSSDKNYTNQFMKPEKVYGKRYDPWANDQDWSLFYSANFLKQ